MVHLRKLEEHGVSAGYVLSVNYEGLPAGDRLSMLHPEYRPKVVEVSPVHILTYLEKVHRDISAETDLSTMPNSTTRRVTKESADERHTQRDCGEGCEAVMWDRTARADAEPTYDTQTEKRNRGPNEPTTLANTNNTPDDEWTVTGHTLSDYGRRPRRGSPFSAPVTAAVTLSDMLYNRTPGGVKTGRLKRRLRKTELPARWDSDSVAAFWANAGKVTRDNPNRLTLLPGTEGDDRETSDDHPEVGR